MKKAKLKLALVVLLFASMGSAIAQIPVFDAATYAQAVQQVEAAKQQFEQMSLQLKQLQDQNASLTGSRGLGSILSNQQLRTVVPANPAQTFQALRNNGPTAMTADALAIRDATKVYDCENRTGADKVTCQAFLNNSAQADAFQQNSMIRLNQRIDQINGLQAQINSTNDPKSIAELTARLVAESAQVANDANRILILQAMSKSADRSAQQALKERELLALSRTGDGSSTFVFKPYVPK